MYRNAWSLSCFGPKLPIPVTVKSGLVTRPIKTEDKQTKHSAGGKIEKYERTRNCENQPGVGDNDKEVVAEPNSWTILIEQIQ